MYRYKAYGLKIASEIAIPELPSGRFDEADVVIRYGEVEKPVFDSPDQHFRAQRTSDGHVYYIQDAGGVHVREGKRITVDPLSGSEDRGFRFLVSGIALGLLLHQRGFVTLHASAVAIRGQVVGFIGQKGIGKSTTAAAFHAHNYSVVTDDLLVLDAVDGRIMAHPGFPHLKLHPESIKRSLGKDPDRVPKIDPMGAKRSYDAKTGFSERALPLRCLYALDYESEGNGVELPFSREMKGGNACMELIRHSYVPRLLPEEAMSRRHLERCAAVGRAVPMRRLYRKKSLESLSELVSYVEQEQGLNGQIPDNQWAPNPQGGEG